jgi:lipoprotein-releasing system ATP-binding protein
VLALIDELGQERASFVVVTHDPGIAAHMHRTLELRGGGLCPQE